MTKEFLEQLLTSIYQKVDNKIIFSLEETSGENDFIGTLRVSPLATPDTPEGDGNYYWYDVGSQPITVYEVDVYPVNSGPESGDHPGHGTAYSGTKVYISVMGEYETSYYDISIAPMEGTYDPISIQSDADGIYFIMPTYDVYVNIIDPDESQPHTVTLIDECTYNNFSDKSSEDPSWTGSSYYGEYLPGETVRVECSNKDFGDPYWEVETARGPVSFDTGDNPYEIVFNMPSEDVNVYIR